MWRIVCVMEECVGIGGDVDDWGYGEVRRVGVRGGDGDVGG